MNSPENVVVAFGSNLGDRENYIQKAIDHIHSRIGWIEKVSGIYETPAWGFEGQSFLNGCLLVSTRFSAENVLQKLLEIEIELGRERGNPESYSNRTIDLDILLYGETIIQLENLKVPHPGIPDRKFVLAPLLDILPDGRHPESGYSFRKLMAETSDPSGIDRSSFQPEWPKKKYHFTSSNYIAIEGNIGAGKTSFSTMISQDFNAKLVLERFKDNPFLPKFYEDRDRYAFSLEMSFLADRYQQLSDDLAQYDLFKDFVISDYDVFKSLIFAKITLQEDEYALYYKLFHLMYKELVKPDLYVYLYQNTDRLLANIKNRGRDYEQNIQPDYLMEINKSYLSFIKAQSNMRVEIIDISELDFVNNREDYLKLIDSIESIFQ